MIWESISKVARSIFFNPNPATRLKILAVYLIVGLLTNYLLLQVFCQPVAWAALAFWVSVLNLIFFPWITRRPHLRLPASFILGFGMPVWIYLAVFLGDPALGFANYIQFAALSVVGFGLLGFLPVYLLQQAVRYVIPLRPVERAVAVAGLAVPLLIFAVAIRGFAGNQRTLNAGLRNSATVHEVTKRVPANYYTERLLGRALKYHTSLEYIYDGWRPPLHDPLLNAYLWFYTENRVRHKFKNQIEVYRAMFPEKPVWLDCACSLNPDAQTYFRHDSTYFMGYYSW